MSKDDATWLNIAYVAFFVIVSYVFLLAIETLGIQAGWAEKFGWFPAVKVFGGLVLGGASTYYLRADADRHDYFLAAIGELRKVTWPNWPDTKRMTLIVCIVVGIFAVVVSMFDLLWAKALKLLLA